jgi:dienelactone hydrolase
MIRGQFLQMLAAVTAVPMPLHVTENDVPYTLRATAYYPARGGPFPLVVLNHGSPFNHADAASQFTRYVNQSTWFVEQGCAVIVPNRRGFGGSTGPFAEGTGSSCSHPNFRRAAQSSAQDILATIDAMREQPQIDQTRIVVAGVSAGGFGSLATAAHAPRGLVGAINFDGGRGSKGPGVNCDPHQLVDIAAEFGATATAPSLWLYAQNDHVFTPALARQMYDAYESARRASGDRFVILPPSGDEGHYLFGTRSAMPLWTPYVRDFLRRVLS